MWRYGTRQARNIERLAKLIVRVQQLTKIIALLRGEVSQEIVVPMSTAVNIRHDHTVETSSPQFVALNMLQGAPPHIENHGFP